MWWLLFFLRCNSATSFFLSRKPSSFHRVTPFQRRAIERIEFTIHTDGRVEEKVTGVKGSDCIKLTEAINNELGVVITEKPTEEMFEIELTNDLTVTETEGESSVKPPNDPSW
ncbi:hypothetical protein ScalyP_jg1283 [Parmales sp. scaly parma]|jgi:hypothetical protein|nr:hypothetical protein ScalyP_jg1283 [Parmales sp. scaly parma]|tara:strand:- start:914 stop:1252 length:339 start_codon:yes stop_codon:yes gene_type:complete